MLSAPEHPEKKEGVLSRVLHLQKPKTPAKRCIEGRIRLQPAGDDAGPAGSIDHGDAAGMREGQLEVKRRAAGVTSIPRHGDHVQRR